MKKLILLLLIVLVACIPVTGGDETIKVTPTRTGTPRPAHTATATSTNVPNTVLPSATAGGVTAAYPSAPLCPDSGENHDNTLFHALWDSARGCHYDHEHGQDPFTAEVAAVFPGFDLKALLGGVGIGHTNPSSPMENTMKHGGFKWQVATVTPQGCITGFEGGTIAVKAYALQFHAFGRQDVEHEVRNHSSVALLAFCKSTNPNDIGYMYVTQLQEYGVRVMPYQGMVLPYPDNFVPPWDGRRGQYFTTECFGADFNINDAIRGNIFIDCRPTFGDVNNNNTIWTSKISGTGARPPGSGLFTLLFRGRDNYQRFDGSDLVHPFTWRFVCGGVNYTPAGCRFNSSTFTIHEVMGNIPAAWDGASLDEDPRPGRVTFQGFVDRFGALITGLECQEAGGNCHPIKLVAAFVGKYSSDLCVTKCSSTTPENTRERDIYFCGLVVCSETSPGAVPSGWIGSEN